MNKEVIDFINQNDNFIVTSHVGPDGDNVGSTLAMYYFLKDIGKKVYYVLDDVFPRNISFLVEGIEVLKSSDININSYNVITLDCGDRRRICIEESLILGANKLINIDHHVSNDSFGDLNIVDGSCSSTCELVYALLKDYEKDVIDEQIATALYTGLITDTGNFMYSSTKGTSFLMAKDLLERGAKKETIIQNVFQSNSFEYYKLLGEALNSLECYEEKISMITVTKDSMERHNISFSNCDGIASYTRDIENIEVGVFIKQKNTDEYKISLRSKTYVDVSEICKNLGGGGHKRASGCTLIGNLDEVKQTVLNEIKKYL